MGLARDIRTTTPIAPDLPIEQLAMPVLLVGTADDPYKTGEVVRYAAGRLPTATALVLETGGHVLIGQDDRIRQAVQAFLGAHATHPSRASDDVGTDKVAAAPMPIRIPRWRGIGGLGSAASVISAELRSLRQTLTWLLRTASCRRSMGSTC